MKKVLFILPAVVLIGCGTSYDKSPEDWSDEICTCASEKGTDSQECFDMMDELKNYYDDANYDLHDKATTLIGECAAELIINHMDQ